MVSNTPRTDKSTDNRSVPCNYCGADVTPAYSSADKSICGECITWSQRGQPTTDTENPWRDEMALRRAYIGGDKTTTELAEAWGCSPSTISNWLNRHDIETGGESMRGARKQYAAMFTMPARSTSYEVWADNRENHVQVHRLLAVAEYGFDAVADKEVHHTNQVPWDNRPENLKVLSKEEHSSIHGKMHGFDSPRSGTETGSCPQYGANWDKQRKKALNRDNKDCVVCGAGADELGRTPDVHHIRPRREYVDEQGNLDYEAANDLENLVTLCQAHHNKWEGVPLRPMASD